MNPLLLWWMPTGRLGGLGGPLSGTKAGGSGDRPLAPSHLGPTAHSRLGARLARRWGSDLGPAQLLAVPRALGAVVGRRSPQWSWVERAPSVPAPWALHFCPWGHSDHERCCGRRSQGHSGGTGPV